LQSVADATESVVTSAGAAFARIDRVFEFDMLYLGQTHTVAVAVDPADGLTTEAIQTAFNTAYRTAYGRLLDGIPVRVMNYRVTVIGRRPAFDMAVFAPKDGKPADACRIGTRTVWAEGAFHQAGLYDRLSLAVGERIAGPAILEQPDTTIFVDPGLYAVVDSFGNLVIRPEV
jgi:N-methylhydantoinase A